jgi:hypothetical protein
MPEKVKLLETPARIGNNKIGCALSGFARPYNLILDSIRFFQWRSLSTSGHPFLFDNSVLEFLFFPASILKKCATIYGKCLLTRAARPYFQTCLSLPNFDFLLCAVQDQLASYSNINVTFFQR